MTGVCVGGMGGVGAGVGGPEDVKRVEELLAKERR